MLQPNPRMPTFIPHHVPPRRLASLPVQIVCGRVAVDLHPVTEHRRQPHQPPFQASP